MRRWGKAGTLQSVLAAGRNGVDRPGVCGYRSVMLRTLYDRQAAAAIAILFGLASLFAAATHQFAHGHALSASSAAGEYILCEFHGTEAPATHRALCEACLFAASLAPAPHSACLDDRLGGDAPRVLAGTDERVATLPGNAHRVRGPPGELV
mgnify:CR=1 FL=1